MSIKKLREMNLAETKKAIKNSVNEDIIVINIINTLEEIEKQTNSLVMRLRDFYKLKHPEAESRISDNEGLVKNVLSGNKEKSVMGANLGDDEETLQKIALMCKELYDTKNFLTKRLESLLQKYAPNMNYLAGATITAKLIREAKSLRKLATGKSSTIQMLGAEKALFRHLKSGANSPKHGVIVNHQIIQKNKDKGKAARILADKISIAAKLDFFKGEFKAPLLVKEIEDKLKWKK